MIVFQMSEKKNTKVTNILDTNIKNKITTKIVTSRRQKGRNSQKHLQIITIIRKKLLIENESN